MEIEAIMLADDGAVPNNPALPLIICRNALPQTASTDDVIELFTANGWRGAWVNGIFPYHHYHARAHEVLANVGAPASVQFGGASGPIIEFPQRAVAMIPAGGGHCRVSEASGLRIVGAYPAGQEDWDLKRADNSGDYARAHAEIASVPLPASDPLGGDSGPLFNHWRFS